MSWTTPITDRTQEDVDYVRLLNSLKWSEMTAQQQADFTHQLKGALNTSDLVRIYANINEINDLYGIGMQAISLTYGKYLTTKIWTDIRDALRTIRLRCPAYPTTPEVPTGMAQYGQINDIEQILQDAYDIYQEVLKDRRYVGETYTHEGWLDLI